MHRLAFVVYFCSACRCERASGLALGLQLTVSYVSITARARERVRVRDRRSEAMNFGANLDR